MENLLLAEYKPQSHVLDIKERLNTLEKVRGSLTFSFRAAVIARYAHWGQVRISSGAPYRIHVNYVANGAGFTDEEKALGYLHDVIEKGGLDKKDIIFLGFPKDIAEDVDLLSTKRGKYFDKIETLIQSERYLRLCRIKCRDIEHNNSDREEFSEQLMQSIQDGDFSAKGTLERRTVFWDFRDPLATHFMSKAMQNDEVRKMTVIEFLKSEYCTENFLSKARQELKKFTSHSISSNF